MGKMRKNGIQTEDDGGGQNRGKWGDKLRTNEEQTGKKSGTIGDKRGTNPQTGDKCGEKEQAE